MALARKKATTIALDPEDDRLLSRAARERECPIGALAPLLAGHPENAKTTRAILGLGGVGGYGFLLVFYVAGAFSVPRRYAVYPDEVAQGAVLAGVSLLFIALLLVGAVLYTWETWRRCLKTWAAA